jgi:predicted site-specific integrase-resolvase
VSRKPRIPELVGTAEAAEILDVERPRIGRWLRAGLMPDPVQRVAATPLWTRKQIEDMKGDRESRRRVPVE